MELTDDLEQLKARFISATHIDYHLDSNGGTAQCCKAAILTLESSLIASSLHSGLSGVLDYLQSKFRWGLAQERHFCKCMITDELACGPSTAMACWSLHFYRDQICTNLSHIDHKYSVISIQIIEQCSIENAVLWRSKLGNKRGQCAEWIRNTCNYHECIGLIDKTTRELTVWDFGVWKRLHTLSESAGAIYSVRLDTRCKGDQSKLAEYESLIQSTVLWEGRIMEFEKWIDLPHDKTVNSLSLEVQSNFIGDVYSPKKNLSDNLTKSLTIYISGVEMGSNPCAGVGVARAIRLSFPDAILTVVDDGGGSAAGGMCDPVFNQAISIALMSVGKKTKTKKNECHGDKFITVFNLLDKDRSAYFLPCRDSDVAAMADGITILTSKVKHTNEEYAYDMILKTYDEEDILSICDRILCPPSSSVSLSDKPDIMKQSTSALKGFFKIPEFFLLEPECGSWVEVQAFAERVGYPVVTKGASQGCLVCLNWFDLSFSLRSLFSEGGFVQKLVYGTDITIAFAGFEGECSGCVVMTKESYTSVGKVWDGRITPLSPVLTKAVEDFVQDSNWTGGGELEMIQDLSGDLWAIDLNIRFPAWIFSTAYSGFNLPGNMIEHVMYARECKVLGARSMQSYISSPYVEYVPFLSLPGKREAMANATAAFTRSTIEIPRTNVTIERTIRLPYCSLSNHTPQNKGGSSSRGLKHKKPLPLLPAVVAAALTTLVPSNDTAIGSDDENNLCARNKLIVLSDSISSSPVKSTETTRALVGVARRMSRDITALITAASQLLLKGPLITPHRVLCIATVTESLERHKLMLKSASNIVNSSRASHEESIELQMCLSVKTQPHRAVLEAARRAQYCAECISLAEVHAAIDAGFPLGEIVLTGPGKFYDVVSEGERTLSGPLRAIFADSLADLKVIVSRVLDPCDWLDCNTIGVRWMPAWQVRSRFGLDPKDMKVVLSVAEIISSLPANKGVGMHFHFASSNLGGDTWFGLAKAFCHFSAGFVSLIKRPVTAIDFGGGWSPYFYVESDEDGVIESTNKKLSSILQSVCTEFEAVQENLPSVQFEPGKCISEAAGGIITRILSVREIPQEGQTDDSTGSEEEKDNQPAGRAFIVDTCIAEISSPHIHPVFWKSKNLQSGLKCNGWLPLPPGDDVIWGRTCMEFDIIHGSFKLPAGAEPGDFLLYAATGSYDFTNSYDFGDGIARSMTLL